MSPDPRKSQRRTVACAAANEADRFGDRVASRYRVDGGWRERTFAEIGELVDERYADLFERMYGREPHTDRVEGEPQ